jgi:hypothetical protein
MTKNELIELASDLLKKESSYPVTKEQQAQRQAVLDRYHGAQEAVQHFTRGFPGMSYHAPELGNLGLDVQAQPIIEVNYSRSKRVWASMKIIFWLLPEGNAPVGQVRFYRGPQTVPGWMTFYWQEGLLGHKGVSTTWRDLMAEAFQTLIRSAVLEGPEYPPFQDRVTMTLRQDEALLLQGLLRLNHKEFQNARNEVMSGMLERIEQILASAQATLTG